MAVQVLVGRASFERTGQRFLRMDELGPVLSLVLGYQESSLVGPVYDRNLKGFQQPPNSSTALTPLQSLPRSTEKPTFYLGAQT